MKIAINCDDNDVTLNKKNYLLRAQERLNLDVFNNYTSLLFPPDYVLNIQPCTVKFGKRWTGLWHIDVLLDSDLPQLYDKVDTLFISTSQTVYPHEKAQLLFQAMDLDLHKRRDDIKQEYDFVLCGSLEPVYYYEREKSIDILSQYFTYKKYGKGKRPVDYIGAINTAKVQFINSGRSNLGKGELAQRFFECLAIGPVLVNWTEDLQYTGLVENRDYMAYRDHEEMIEKMKQLIADGSLRNRIAISGRKAALLNHTYEHRLISIINTVKEYDLNNNRT